MPALCSCLRRGAKHLHPSLLTPSRFAKDALLVYTRMPAKASPKDADASARSGHYSSSSSAGHTENRTSHPCDAGVASPCPCSCSCPLFSCGWQGDLEVVALHLKDTHRASTLQGQRIVFLAADVHLLDAEDWVTVQSCLGQQFLLVLKKQERRQGHQQYFAAVMLLGPSRVAERFTYRLELSSERRRLSWESAVRSFAEGLGTVIAESDCLVLNASLAHLFSDKGKLGIRISISADKQA
ncbi:seven in absentia homolog 3-like [Polyodon spathula]|uniref:seven in absentia homolog 3-like n=1 Tax=Polyodon spathula TaxID=7913 RepID=UPI001B7E62A5|nr:seven in absentia homolog 3-like [Polyodon spathula]